MGSSWDSALPAEYPGVSSHSSLQGVAYPVNHLSLFCPAKRNHASAAVRENGATSPGVYELSRNPSTNREDKKRIERVHRKATKLFTSIRNRPYEGRLRLLDLPSLYHRRRRGDMITVYQVFRQGDPEAEAFFAPAATGNTSKHRQQLLKPRAVSGVRQNVFSVRVINDWNALPPSVVAAPSLNAFKARLDKH